MCIMNVIGIASIFLAILSVPASLVSGIGVAIALLVLLLSGISALSGKLKYAIIVLIITTLNLFFFSVASLEWMPKATDEISIELPNIQGIVNNIDNSGSAFLSIVNFVKLVSVPYVVTIVLIAIGVFRRKKTHNQCAD